MSRAVHLRSPSTAPSGATKQVYVLPRGLNLIYHVSAGNSQGGGMVLSIIWSERSTFRQVLARSLNDLDEEKTVGQKPHQETSDPGSRGLAS